MRWLMIVLTICGALALLSHLVSFALLNSYSRSVGGRPSLGKIEDGRYYVGNHGPSTEVSEADWNRGVALERWSLTSVALTVLVTLALVIFGLRGASRRKSAEASGALDRQP